MYRIELSQEQLDEILKDYQPTSKMKFGEKIRKILTNQTPTCVSEQIIYTQEQLDALNIKKCSK